MTEAGTSRPTPDPTVLTTEQLERAIGGLKELMKAEIRAQEDVCNEKFVSVGNQFALVERQRVEQKKDTKDAVDAAFSAAKEAVKEQTTASDRAIAKSEASMLEQLRQLSTTFTTAVSGVTTTVGDLKDRVGTIESVKRGAGEQRTETREGISSAQALVGGIVALIAVVASLYFGVRQTPEPVVVQPTVTVPSSK